MNREEIYQMCCKINNIYGNGKVKVSIEALTDFEEIYAPYEAEDMFDALRLHIERSNYAPRPSDLIALVPEAINNRRRKERDRQMAEWRYAPDGQRIYACPYCCDTGYMAVELPGDQYIGGYALCVHHKPKALRELEAEGSFGLWLKKWHFRGRLRWDADRKAFVPIDIDVKPARIGEMLTAEELNERLTDFELPF